MPIKFEAVFSHHEPGQSPVQENTHEVDLDRGLLILVDGFGGIGVGDEVAKLVATSVRKYLLKKSEDEEATMPFVLRKYYSLVGNVLFNALLYANHEVLKWNRGRNVNERGGASITACLLDGDYLAVAQVGSTQAGIARHREGGASGQTYLPLTQSRSFGRSTGTGEGAEAHLPLMAIGMTDDLEPEIWEYRVYPGDWITIEAGMRTGKGQAVDQVPEKMRQLRGKPLSDRLDQLQGWFKAEKQASVNIGNHSLLVAFVEAE